MPVIPQKIYRAIEGKLRDRWTMVPRAEMALCEAQAKAMDVSAPAMDGVHVQTGGQGSRVQRGVENILAAEKRLEEARAWQDVFRLMDKTFPFESTPEGAVAGYLYGNGMTVEQVCLATGRKRSTIIHIRDNYVAHCALFAAGRGLIDIREE